MNGKQLKEHALDPNKRVLCPYCNCDGYCPNAVEKARCLTDKQWDNIAKKLGDDFAGFDLLSEIMGRRLRPKI